MKQGLTPWVNLYIRAEKMIEVKPYNLPDAGLFSGSGDAMLIWQPDKYCIVLGQSNTPEKSLIIENVLSDNIAVTKRPTGGEAVVLSPSMAVITAARDFTTLTSSKEFFSEMNSIIIEALTDLGIQNLDTKGISDITIGDRKILGSSMHRRENRMVYHAVLNIAEDPQLFEKYLRHPLREPDYRKNRSHSEFVTSLWKEGYYLSTQNLESAMNRILTPEPSHIQL